MAPRTIYANLPDGLQPFSLFDQSFADMGSLGVIPCTASGTNAITLTPIGASFSPNVNTPPNPNQLFSFVATATSTGAVTVSIAGVTGFLNLYRMDAATQAASGDIQNKVTYVVSFGSALNSAAGGFQIQSPINNEINPIISGATITNSTYNGNIWTAGTGTLTIAAGKTETFNNTLTFAGTDGTTMTFPTTSATIARTDVGQTFTGTNAFGVITATTVNGNTFTTGTYTITGTAAKTLTFNNSLTLAGTDATTITFQASDTYVGRATTDTLTNKTFDTAGTGNSFKINGIAITANTGTGNNVLATTPTISQPNLVGTTTNDSAAAGSVGEYISSDIPLGSHVSLTTATAVDITTISLTAGDWDIWAVSYFNGGSTTVIDSLSASISTTLNTLDQTDGKFATVGHVGTVFNSTFLGAWSVPVGPARVSLSGTTTFHLVVRADFTTSTAFGYGILQARRRR